MEISTSLLNLIYPQNRQFKNITESFEQVIYKPHKIFILNDQSGTISVSDTTLDINFGTVIY